MSAPTDQRILVGIDGSESSMEALRLAARLAEALDAPLEAIACAGDPTVLDAELIRLEVEAANGKAIAFYASQGFRQMGQTANCGKEQSGIPALIFERSLR